MGDYEHNVEGYRAIADVLIGFRRIILRGLVRQCGETWFRDGCPPEVYHRLVNRKETEMAIERAPGEYEDLISFTTFADLAEIIDGNPELGQLLHALAANPQVLVARLTELENLRAKISRATPLSDDELKQILGARRNLRERVMSAKRGKAPPPPPVTAVKPPADMVEPADDEVDILDEPILEDTEGLVEPVAEVAASVDEAETAAEAVSEVEEVAEHAVATEHPPMPDLDDVEEGEAQDYLTEADRDVQIPEEPPLDEILDEELLEGLERGLAEGDDAEVLRALRREIIAVAERMHRRMEISDVPVWKEVQARGWLAKKMKKLGLEAIDTFYGLVDVFENERREGMADEGLRALLAEREFTKLLLELREVFLRNV